MARPFPLGLNEAKRSEEYARATTRPAHRHSLWKQWNPGLKTESSRQPRYFFFAKNMSIKSIALLLLAKRILKKAKIRRGNAAATIVNCPFLIINLSFPTPH